MLGAEKVLKRNLQLQQTKTKLGCFIHLMLLCLLPLASSY